MYTVARERTGSERYHHINYSEYMTESLFKAVEGERLLNSGEQGRGAKQLGDDYYKLS